jgi:hypothetical protein
VFGPSKDALELLDHLRSFASPVEELSSWNDGDDAWRIACHHRGRTIRLAIGRDEGVVGTIRYAAALEVPVRMHVEGHFAHHASLPVIVTDDAVFDARFKVHGSPAAVVQRVLDAPTRAWFVATYGALPPQAETDGGWLSLAYVVGPRDGLFGFSPMPRPEELARAFDRLIDLVDRATSAYRAERAHVEATRGPSAAASWHAAHHDAVEALRHRREAVSAQVATVERWAGRVAGGVALLVALLALLVLVWSVR